MKKRFIFLFLLYFVMARSNSSDPNGDQIENLASKLRLYGSCLKV